MRQEATWLLINLVMTVVKGVQGYLPTTGGMGFGFEGVLALG